MPRVDQDAFYALMDKARQNPGVKVRSMKHLAELIEQRQQNQNNGMD